MENQNTIFIPASRRSALEDSITIESPGIKVSLLDTRKEIVERSDVELGSVNVREGRIDIRLNSLCINADDDPESIRIMIVQMISEAVDMAYKHCPEAFSSRG